MELCPFLRVHCFSPYISTLGSSISTLQVPLQCLSCSDEESEWMQVQVPWASSSYVAHSSRHLDQWRTLISVLWYSFSCFAYESWLQKECGALLATMGDKQPEKSQGSIIMSLLHADYLSWAEFTLVWEFSCKGELGYAWQNAYCVYILSVCTKLDVYLQGTLGKWFLLGSTSGRLQAYVALALIFASSSCLKTCFTWKLGEMLNRQSLSCSWYKSAAMQHSTVFSFPDSCRGTFKRN